MNLYLDDVLAAPLLAKLLRNAGHDVRLPSEIGMGGATDPVHMIHAIREGRVILSRNYGDFEDLHDLILEVKGHHPGILVIRRDNNPARNLKPRDIVRAIRNLEGAGLPVADQYITLNAWQ